MMRLERMLQLLSVMSCEECAKRLNKRYAGSHFTTKEVYSLTQSAFLKLRKLAAKYPLTFDLMWEEATYQDPHTEIESDVKDRLAQDEKNPRSIFLQDAII